MSDPEKTEEAPVRFRIGLRSPSGPPSQPSPAGDQALDALEDAGVVEGIREPGQPTRYRALPVEDGTDDEK